MTVVLGLLSGLLKVFGEAVPAFAEIAKAIDADRLRMQMHKAGQESQKVQDLEYQRVRKQEKDQALASINARVESMSHDDIIAELRERIQRRDASRANKST